MNATGNRSSRRAILFDLDGTLVDSYDAITQSVNHVRSLHGLPPMDEQEVRRKVGRGVAHLMNVTVPAGDVEQNVQYFASHHPSVLLSGTKVLPEVLEVLQELRTRGMLLGVCSNKPLPLIRELLRLLQMDEYFTAILGPESVSATKPAPDILFAAMRQLGVRAEETLYVGDMVIDIETARAAGVEVWVIATGSESAEVLRNANPDRFLSRFSELLKA